MLRTIACGLLMIALGTINHPIAAQSDITAKQWREDLQFLQQTVHGDYPFLFKKITAAKFDQAVAELDAAIPKLETHEIVAGLARIVALFKYGHTSVDLRRGPVKYQMLPLNLYSFSDGIYIQAAEANYADLVGARVLKIAGMDVNAALKAIAPLVPAENSQFLRAHGMSMLCIPEALHAQRVTDSLQSEVTFSLERDGKTFDATVAAVPATRIPNRYGYVDPSSGWVDARSAGDPPLYLSELEKIYRFDYLPDERTVYVRHSQIQDDPDEPIPAFYQRVFQFIEDNDVDRLVLDVRLNGGGNNYKNKTIVQQIIRCNKINQPGKLFVVLGRRTFSACQNLVNELDNYTNAIFVGEPTSENINFYGDSRRIELPNSQLPVDLSFAWWQDKPQWENADWLGPDLAVELTFADYRDNRDPVLDAILKVSADNLIVDPMAHLRQLFEENKLDQLTADAHRIVKDPRYKFIDLEPQINKAGYDLLQNEQSAEARFVFRLNTELFPDSANAWDSLAEWHYRQQDNAQAAELYRKASGLDPNGPVGDNSRQMLQRIGQTDR